MILLDTHAWIWFVDNPDLLGPAARKAVEHAAAEGTVHVSAISTWEVFMLVKKGRLRFRVDPQAWVARCERVSFFDFVPVTNDIARLAVALPDSAPPDPADRLIMATAAHLGVPLVTKDDRIRSCKAVRTVW